MPSAKHYLMTADEKAATGFSDLFVVPYNDPILTAAVADNTAVQLILDALAFGDLVGYHALLEVTTAWAGPADLTATVSLGVTGAATQIIGASTITTAGSGAAAATGFAPAAGGAAYVTPTGGKNLLLEFTPDADSGVDEFTAGELRVWCNISRINVRNAAQG